MKIRHLPHGISGVILLCMLTSASFADEQLPESILVSVPGAGEVGSTRVSVFVWDIYDIALYAPNGIYDTENEFALHLSYLRPIKGELIAKKSVDEMRKQGISEVRLAAWFVQMKEIFPDVDRGTELIGIFRPGEATRFYRGNELIGEVIDPQFGPAFSEIWLGKHTSVPELRESLLGKEG